MLEKDLPPENWQYHYVVVYNEETGKFSVDVDTTDAVFHNGQIFRPDSQEWYAPHDVDDPYIHRILMDIEDKLSEILNAASDQLTKGK